MGRDALRHLGFRAFQARRAALTFRRHDEDSVRELARMRHDSTAYISRAREKIKDLEEILLAELRDQGKDGDAAWDAAGLGEEPGNRAGTRQVSG